ncbi:transcriptional regulator [Streptomyces sp. Ru73]|uniref:helix-turn-helix domain-containing protein n=1 Tax=Streptomyces sp. Ru73 TaxID=2080748 RepID=UPI000CDD99D5|nr:helix-turn-helix transcriptional regulator [Streptomyces sp. Ru73]POX40865.1 transcriptional regulator [Streptomyces sp. Ru73]
MLGEGIPESRSAYGTELRQRREAAGLTQEALSQRAIMSRTHIAHIEAGRRKPSLEDARRLDQVLDTGGFFERFLPTLSPRSLADYFAEAAGLEQQALMIRAYESSLVPGLLQTEAYTRAVLRTYYPRRTDEACDKVVVTRLERARIFDDPVRPVMWFLLDEAVLRRPVGGPATMAAQLRHIAELGSRERIRVHVLPFAVGAHPLQEASSVMLMWFEDAAPIVYAEGLHTGNIVDLPFAVHQCQTLYDQALGDALSHKESLALIAAVTEEYAHVA